MARYPEAEWLPLPENATEPSIHPTQVILHSAVSNASSLRPYFGRSDVVVESHFYVRKDGSVEQYVDTDRQADANYKANARAISIETWDGGDPDRTPWNRAQLDSLVALVRWCCATYGIPARHAPAWDAPGIGGHSDYAQWSNVRGKTCPGLARRPQVQQIIAAAATTVLGSRIPDLTPAVEPEPEPEDDMALALISTSDTSVWWVYDGYRKRALAPGEPQRLVDLGLLKPDADGNPPLPKFLDPLVITAIPNA